MTVKIFDAIAEQRASESIFPLRSNEPDYALLSDTKTQESNRYGQLIALTNLVDEAQSLNINGVSEKGFNPNRNKQHAFHFTADNCIGCHACESACSEKNDLPAHLSFRSVGYVEGGSYPNYTRMNISMACNHCDDPVCLKGCPTRAYTKHAEYGAVIQDPDICFGCGYCTWVCPYNAPQLDPVAGQVEKCNMCVDRLEVGLKPACVSACLGNALNFGVVENTPDKREQIETSIPGFPDPEITHPNIRFQQTRSMPRELTRTDSAPVKYRRSDESGQYKPMVDAKGGSQKHWNLARLNSRENPLVLFTLATQASIGLFLILLFGQGLGFGSLAEFSNSPAHALGLLVSLVLVAGGLGMSAMHLGKPMRFYRGFNNIRHSPMAREGACAAVFMTAIGIYLICTVAMAPWALEILPALRSLKGIMEVAAPTSAGVSAAAAAGTLYYMYRCYRIKARPFWDHWQSASTFVGCALYLGAVAAGLSGLGLVAVGALKGIAWLTPLSIVMVCGVLIEAIGLLFHARDMSTTDSEGAVSHYVQCSTFGKTYILRNVGLVATIGLLVLASSSLSSSWLLGVWLLAALCCVVLALIGRALFYVLVTPTTMPGAFFWKNKGFEEHARDIGLADMPQVGVAANGH